MKSDFRNLKVWQKGRDLRLYVFTLTKQFPKEEKTKLTDQVIRSSRSITNNIAEGYGRFHFKDNIRLCNQARGSIYETLDHAEIAFECKYINQDTYQQLTENIEEILALTNGYIKYLREKHQLNKPTT
ncbi:MAG: four helix bundle protein [Bacteroidia bacterium]|nr:four helix bundle protein [Bacteroidia bacterium]